MVVPLLLLLFLGVYEFGRAWQVHHAITDAAREGARAAAIYDENMTADSIRYIINEALARSVIDTTQATKTLIGWTGGAVGSGLPVTVQISYDHDLGLVGSLLNWSTSDQTKTFQTSFTMRKE